MLIPNFYKIKKFEEIDHQIHAAIRLNPDHELYRGHFPGQPVMPGVVQLQIVKELLEKALEKNLLLSRLVSAKYYAMIIPGDSTDIEISIRIKTVEDGEYKITAEIKNETTLFTKVRAVLTVPATSVAPPK